MPPTLDPQLLVVSGGGLLAGLGLLVRGLGGYRRAGRIADTAPSRIASIAVGEVLSAASRSRRARVAAQSVDCVLPVADEEPTRNGAWNSANNGRWISNPRRDGQPAGPSAGCAVRHSACFDEKSGVLGEEPAGLMMRAGRHRAPADRDAGRRPVDGPPNRRSLPSAGEVRMAGRFASDQHRRPLHQSPSDVARRAWRR
jgi:hypothetical protein